MKKKLCAFLVSLLAILPALGFDTPYFTGHAGFLGQTRSDPVSDYVDPMFFAQGYFGGEIDFSDKLILRSDFFIRTRNLISDELLDNPDSFYNTGNGFMNGTFQVQELSAVYKMHTAQLTHYISAFFGEYEPVGSDMFLQRQFGIPSITSKLTESWHGRNGSSINAFYGAGVSYVIRFEEPVAVGFYAYEDFTTINDTLTQNKFNTDVRFAFAFPFLTLDFSMGLGFPKDSTEGSFDTDFLIVRYVTMHTGFSMLAGSPSDTFSLFVQGGFSDASIYAESDKNDDIADIILKNMYFLIEPRVSLQNINLTFTFFNIPETRLLNLVYVFDPLGIDVSVSSDSLYFGNINFTLGMHATLSKKTTLKAVFDDADNFADADLTFRLTPFTTIPLFGGSISSAMSVDMTNLLKFEDNWMSNFILSLGFRTQF